MLASAKFAVTRNLFRTPWGCRTIRHFFPAKFCTAATGAEDSQVYTLICQECGRTYQAKSNRSTPRNGQRQPRKYCSQACCGAAQRREDYLKNYRSVYVPGANRFNARHEHRIIAERALGHPLPQAARIHHWNENTQDNRPENLVICENQRYHFLLHWRMHRLRDTGSLDLKRCNLCRLVKPLAEFGRMRRKWDGRNEICRDCKKLTRKRTRYEIRQSNCAPM